MQYVRRAGSADAPLHGLDDPAAHIGIPSVSDQIMLADVNGLPVASGVSIDADERMAGLASADLDIAAPVPAHAEGRVYWDVAEHAIVAMNDDGTVRQQLGQEDYVRVRNETGSSIVGGAAVYIVGTDAGEFRPSIALALASAAETSSSTLGLVTSGSIADDAYGYVTVLGLVNGLDTSALAVGPVWVSPSVAGGLTSTRPANGQQEVIVGYCTRVHATLGRILVLPGGNRGLRASNTSQIIDILPSGAPAPVTIVTASTRGFELPNLFTRSVIGNFEVPAGVDLAINPVLIFGYYVSGLGAGNANVRLQIDLRYIASGEQVDKAIDQTIFQTLPVVNTMDALASFSFTLTGALIAAGDRISFSAARLGGNAADTFTGAIVAVDTSKLEYSVL